MCTGRSFAAASEANLIQFEKGFFRLVGEATSGDKLYKIESALNLEGTKQVKLNSVPARPPELSKIFPVVAVTPEEILVIFGAPALRRKFLDSAISFHHTTYASTLWEYQKVLEQRNRAIKDFRGRNSGVISGEEAWNQQLIELGSQIILKRREYISLLKERVEKHYAEISGWKEKLELGYEMSFPYNRAEELRQEFARQLEVTKEKERQFGATLIGPHRDDLDIKINSNLAREFGSYGQGRSALLSLKLGQVDLLKKERGQNPLLLLDETFSDLDQRRTEYLSQILFLPGQIFISTSKEWELPEKLKQGRIFQVAEGDVG